LFQYMHRLLLSLLHNDSVGCPLQTMLRSYASVVTLCSTIKFRSTHLDHYGSDNTVHGRPGVALHTSCEFMPQKLL
jgi:hypothetical protein